MARSYEVKGSFLLEDGVQVAKLAALPFYRVAFTWFSERAKARYESLCDSISIGEGVEALGFKVRP